MTEQLTLQFGSPTCACGRELMEHIEHYRALCCMCILRACWGNPDRFSHEDPEHKRAHLRAWLAERGWDTTCTNTPKEIEAP